MCKTSQKSVRLCIRRSRKVPANLRKDVRGHLKMCRDYVKFVRGCTRTILAEYLGGGGLRGMCVCVRTDFVQCSKKSECFIGTMGKNVSRPAMAFLSAGRVKWEKLEGRNRTTFAHLRIFWLAFCCRFRSTLEIQGFGGRRFSQESAENRRFSQEIAGLIWFLPLEWPILPQQAAQHSCSA